MNTQQVKKEGIEVYKKNLSEVCSLSKIEMCPGCGLTPEGLEYIIEATRKDLIEAIEGTQGITIGDKEKPFQPQYLKKEDVKDIIRKQLEI